MVDDHVVDVSTTMVDEYGREQFLIADVCLELFLKMTYWFDENLFGRILRCRIILFIRVIVIWQIFSEGQCDLDNISFIR